MSKPKTIIEASTNGKNGVIRIVDRIGEWSASSSATVRAIIDDYLKNGVTDVEVYINSAGGNCFEAEEICNELDRMPNKPTIQVGSMAASAASFFLTRFHSTAFPNSQIMIHRPRLGTYGDIFQIEADLQLLRNTNDIYKNSYSAKMNKTPEQIEADYFAKGDCWLTANQALAAGLINAILDKQEEVTAESIKILEAMAAPVIPTINNQNKKSMERIQLISTLGLSADATDAQIETALTAMKAKADTATSLEASAAQTLEADAKSLAKQAFDDKKITADLIPTYEGMAKADFAGTKKAIDAMHAVTQASKDLDLSADGKSNRANWTMEDYQAKDPEALSEMIVKEPEAFKKLEAEYFAGQ